MDFLNIDKRVLSLSSQVENELKDEFSNCDRICFLNTKKVLNAFIKNKVSAEDFNGTNGYGYNDIRREKNESWTKKQNKI